MLDVVGAVTGALHANNKIKEQRERVESVENTMRARVLERRCAPEHEEKNGKIALQARGTKFSATPRRRVANHLGGVVRQNRGGRL